MPYAVLFLPLLAAVAILLFTRRNRGLSAVLSIGAILLAFCLSLCLYFRDGGTPERIRWLTIGTAPGPVFELSIGYMLDHLSKLMLLVVTGVGSLIHIYSWGYMRNDDSVPRYFGGLSLFTFSMLGIVLADNLVMMFIFPPISLAMVFLGLISLALALVIKPLLGGSIQLLARILGKPPPVTSGSGTTVA